MGETFSINPRFYGQPRTLTALEIVDLLRLHDTSTQELSRAFQGISGLQDATPFQVSYCHQSFLKNTHYEEMLQNTKAGAVLVTKDMAHLVPKDTLCWVTPSPYRDFSTLIKAFYPKYEGENHSTSIHPTAVIDPTAMIEEGCMIDAYVVIEGGVEIGKGTQIMSHTTVGQGCILGEKCRIASHVSLSHCVIGRFVHIKTGARIGQSGFGFEMDQKGPIDMPQMGSVIVHNHVEIGSNTCIDRGSFGDTIIGEGTRIDNLVQIAHNVKIGKYCVMVAQVGISGSTTFGNYAMAGGQAGFSGHLTIGDGAKIAAQSGVMRDIPSHVDMAGSPAIVARDWHKQTIALKKMIRGKVEKTR